MKNESREFAYILMERIGRPRNLIEVGAYRSDHIVMLPFIFDPKCRIRLIEPNPTASRELRRAFSSFPNIEVIERAVGDSRGEARLSIPRILPSNPHADASAFLQRLPGSPYLSRLAAGRHEEVNNIVVNMITFDEIDDGEIDGLVADIEGAEWYVLQMMKSRPAVISIEMEGPCGYRNPFFSEIEKWMQVNAYFLATVERVQGTRIPTDHIYVRRKG